MNRQEKPKVFKVETYSSTTLVQHLKYMIESKSEIKYCFILGAGASKSSGISTGYELANRWFGEIKKLFPDYKTWVRANRIDENNVAKHYGVVYKKRFSIRPEEGYEFLQREMENSEPSFGYSVLAKLLESQNNVVVTTNFDSLVEDALFTYSKNKPLVCGHESLSEFVKPSGKRPIIIKVHRDLLLNPKNEDGDLQKLEDGFKASLDRIFQVYTPIVIGYGGNDLSLMNYLLDCTILNSICWCHRGPEPLSKEIKDLLASKPRSQVYDIAGFDDLMFQLYVALYDDKRLDKHVEDIAKGKADAWRNKLNEFTKNIKDKDSQASLKELVKDKKYMAWWDVQLAVNAEKDIEKQNKLYKQGLKQFESSAELNGNYAIYLKNIKKDYLESEKFYLKALSLDPNDAIYNINYANYLHGIKKDYPEAEKYYLKALSLDPNNADFTGDYANYLCDTKKDYVEAEKYYLKALSLDPKNAINIGNYANYLQNIKKDYAEAEKYYLKALRLDPNDADNTGNYSQLLIHLNKMSEAKAMIEKAFELNQNDNEKDINAELWLYRFANFYKDYPEAKAELEKLIAAGVKSIGWDFSINIEKAKEQNHPHLSKVIHFAKQISEN